jgi:hypothetical protein
MWFVKRNYGETVLNQDQTGSPKKPTFFFYDPDRSLCISTQTINLPLKSC